MSPVNITYYSDILCIWAYISQRRIDELVEKFSDEVSIEVHYCSVFPDAWGKIGLNWKDKGGFAGFNQHLRHVASQFPHVDVHDRLWLETRPRTSASGHTFLKAIEIIEREGNGCGAGSVPYADRLSTRAAWELRRAFFAMAKDISDWRVHRDVADCLGIDYATVEERIRSSEAVTELAVDYSLSQKQGVEGSPTFVMNDGRQKLFGNISYRLLEANVAELLRAPAQGEASWC